jgi:hypothetical protein
LAAELAPEHEEVRAALNEAGRTVRIIFPPLEKPNGEQTQAAPERAPVLRRQREVK